MISLAPLKEKLQGKAIAILGLGKSGMPVFEACKAAGIATIVWDDGPDARKAAEAAGATLKDLSVHDYKDVACLCMSPGIPLTHPKPHPAALKAKAAGVEVLGDIELFRRAKPKNRTIAITGTNGKSTTTALIGHILKEAKVPSAVGGNIGEAILTLPDLPDEAIYVLEMSSYQIDLCPTFAPEISILINLSPDHLDRHGDMGGYIAAKENIFRGPGTAIIGIDDEWSQGVAERVRRQARRKIVQVSCERPLMSGVFASKDGALFDGKKKILDLNKCPSLPGAHNWQNAGMAYAACRAAGLEPEVIAKAMQSFPGLAHRQNIIAAINSILYINDSKATNDQAAGVALRTYDPIYWIAGGKPKDGGYADCEKYLGHVHHTFLIGEAEDVMSAWLSGKGKPFTLCKTLDNAVALAHTMAQAQKLDGAVVLLSPACASFDQYKNFEQRGDAFVALVKKLVPVPAVTAKRESA
ncbi:MAG: UDP-N-acetylmuramoyl-L-alanine--D-glutamate ligase [Alphaproteobacteria bacterium]